MNIELRYGVPMRRWHLRLRDALRDAGHRVNCVPVKKVARLPGALELMLAAQRRVFGPKQSPIDKIATPADASTRDRGAPDLVILADGGTCPEAHLGIFVDGGEGAAHLIAAVAAGGTPNLRIRLQREGASVDVVAGRLAVEQSHIASRALEMVFARLVALLVVAVRRAEDGTGRAAMSCEALAAPPRSPVWGLLRGSVRAFADRVPGRARLPEHWRIAYRRTAGISDGVASRRTWSGPFDVLPDDGLRFQADPMPFEADDRVHLFFEDYPYATQKGRLMRVEIASDGTASPPRVVLEQPFHLSYPMLIRHAGEIYMMPEMSQTGRVQLFRADPFPDSWRPDRVLLADCVASDPTPVFHAGRWWLFATLHGDGGSSWDQLGLFHAPELFGPWTPHIGNPVLVDSAAARPAGAMWHEGGVLMRVAQDCRAGYGMGLTICRVDRLDEEGFSQTIVACLGAPGGYDAEGVHTLNRSASLEVIDLRFPRRDRSARYRRRAVPRAPARD